MVNVRIPWDEKKRNWVFQKYKDTKRLKDSVLPSKNAKQKTMKSATANSNIANCGQFHSTLR